MKIGTRKSRFAPQPYKVTDKKTRNDHTSATMYAYLMAGDANPTFDEWLKLGYDLGFCGPPVCPHHDGIPMSFAEETVLEADGDWCTFIVRLYQDENEKRAVQKHHPPTSWRAVNLGW